MRGLVRYVASTRESHNHSLSTTGCTINHTTFLHRRFTLSIRVVQSIARSINTMFIIMPAVQRLVQPVFFLNHLFGCGRAAQKWYWNDSCINQKTCRQSTSIPRNYGYNPKQRRSVKSCSHSSRSTIATWTAYVWNAKLRSARVPVRVWTVKRCRRILKNWVVRLQPVSKGSCGCDWMRPNSYAIEQIIRLVADIKLQS